MLATSALVVITPPFVSYCVICNDIHKALLSIVACCDTK